MSREEVMERLSWFIELRAIFDSISEEKTVAKSKVLLALTESITRLPLKSPREYALSSPYQGFSFEDIYSHIQAMPRVIKWDELLDSLACLGIYTKGVSTLESINLVPIKSERKEDLKDKGTLKSDFPEVKLYSLSELAIGHNLRFLSIGGNSISNANFEFPSSLIVLNLSYNAITEFYPQKPLSNLKFLNLSQNLIENLNDISSIITLNELLIFNNKLKSANFFFSIKDLALLDIGNNDLSNFEDLAMLSVSTRLHTLNLLGNPISNKQGYKGAISELFPRLMYMDPVDISMHSKYQQIGFCAVENLKNELNFTRESNFVMQTSVMSDYRPVITSLSGTGSRNYTADSSPTSLKGRSRTPMAVEKTRSTQSTSEKKVVKHGRSRSQAASGSLATTPSLNSSCTISVKKPRVIDQKKANTAKISFKHFGDPIAAMMIGPPAVGNIFKSPLKKPNFSIDITRFKRK